MVSLISTMTERILPSWSEQIEFEAIFPFKGFWKEDADPLALKVTKGPEVLSPLSCYSVDILFTVNRSFLWEDDVVFVHTEPFKNIHVFFIFTQTPHIQGDDSFGWGWCVALTYGFMVLSSFPTATRPVGRCPPHSVSSGRGLGLRFSLRPIICRTSSLRSTPIAPSPGLRFGETLRFLREGVHPGELDHPPRKDGPPCPPVPSLWPQLTPELFQRTQHLYCLLCYYLR